MNIPILYHDESLAVCLKPPGTDAEGAGMPRLLAAQLGAEEVFCVHRLDRAVGGVMVYALSGAAAAGLSAALREGRLRKEYLAVVHGAPAAPEGTLRDLLFHDRVKNKSYVVARRRAGVREAVLDYRAEAEAEGLSLLAVRLQTGRTHQIRVQLAARKTPLVGDAKYGSPRRDCPIALWSHALGFRHPVSGEALSFSAPPPKRYPWTLFAIGEA